LLGKEPKSHSHFFKDFYLNFKLKTRTQLRVLYFYFHRSAESTEY